MSNLSEHTGQENYATLVEENNRLASEYNRALVRAEKAGLTRDTIRAAATDVLDLFRFAYGRVTIGSEFGESIELTGQDRDVLRRLLAAVSGTAGT